MMRDEDLQAAIMLERASRALAAAAVDRQLSLSPDAADRYSAAGFPHLHDDTAFRFTCLAQAVACDRPALFTHDVAWLKVALHARGLSPDLLADNLQAMWDAAGAELPRAAAERAQAGLRRALVELPAMPERLVSRLREVAPHRDLAARYMLAVLELHREEARALLERALAAGAQPGVLAREVLMFVQAEVGRMWQMNELSVAEEHLVSEVNEDQLRWLYEHAPREAPSGRRVLATSVSGDLHRLGARWVAHAFAAAGWETVYLGANMPAAELGAATAEFGADVLCLSASLAVHVRAAAETVAAVRAASPGAAIVVGGNPFLIVPDLWRIVGADAAAQDALAAVAKAEALVAPR